MRSEWVPKGEICHILAGLQPQNRLACEISLFTGLRINDVLNLKPAQIAKGRFTVREEKTGKTKFIRLNKDLQTRALSYAGQHFVFEHRLNGRLHRTRQAVFKDLRKSAVFSRLKNISARTACERFMPLKNTENMAILNEFKSF